MIDKFYLMRKEFNIKLNKIKDIKDALKANNSTISDKEINKFIKLAINPKTRQDAYNKYPNLAKDFRRMAFSVDKPTKGKRARNNQVVDMSLAVLRHKTSTARILNPGGFEAQKRMGYLVTAYKLGKGDWEYLNSLSTDDLKKLCYTDKNLTYIDTNAQFYNQNNVAGAILGMFAVQKTAHATLENNGYHLNVSQALGLGEGQIFSFAGYSLIGMMELDATTNSKGEYIGKVLGSLVASAADAVKDPVLNLMNINSTTAPVLTAMIRLGIPFETASLLLSQDVITEVLNQFAIENISNYKSFTEILNDKIEDLKKTIVAKEGDDLSTEEITEEELIEDLTPNAADNIKYKSLIALKKFITLSQQIKGITYTTRLNSLSGAVGPLVIDNIIMNDKLQNFGDCIYKEEITDDESKWVRQTSEDVLNEHLILRGFSKGLDVAQEIFEDFIPIVSRDFNTVLSKLSPDTKQKLFADRKLFSKFVDFYNSYLLAASGCVNTSTEHTKYLIEEFPQQVIDSKIKERYPNNKFIQALKFDNETIPGGTRLVIKVETTGMDTTDKEVLSSGWADLHKDNPKLSKLLFEYCFVKGGIGFTPKTFMHLLPVEVKMQMKDYINTFKNKPNTNADLVIDQFVRNNSKNNKLAPKIEPNRTNAKYNTDTKELILSGSNYDMVSDLTYCKIKLKDGKYHLFFITKDKRIATLVEVSVLGNNGEYLELSTKNISKEGNNTVIENTNDTATFIPEASNQDGDNNALIIEGLSQDEISYYSELLASAFESPNSVPNFRKRSDKDKAALKKNYETFFTNKFKELGIEYNQSEFDKLYKVFCG